MMAFVAFVPFMLISLVANLTERHSEYRWITLALLAVSNLLVLASALLIILLQLAANVTGTPVAMPMPSNLMATAAVLAATGLLGFVPLVPGVRRLLARRLKIEPSSCVHTTALVFAVYLVGLTMSQLPLVGGLEGLESLELNMGQSELWLQGLALFLLALIGIGSGLRRDATESAVRLGLRWPTWKDLLLVLGLLILLEGLDYGVSWAWETFDPSGYERIGRISQQLFSGFATPLGAIAVGLVAGISEETLFRGALQPRLGLLLTSLLFAIIHVQYGFSPATLLVFIIGMVLGWLRKKSGLVACIVLHASYNIVNLLLASLWP